MFVEKPPALTEEELIELELALPAGRFLMTGFNRRFAPMTAELKALLDTATNRMVSIRVNAGALPPDHWLNDPHVGRRTAARRGMPLHRPAGPLHRRNRRRRPCARLPQHHRPSECSESFVVTLRFAGGSLGTLLYTDQGDPRMGKERIEAYGSGQSATIDDFRHLDLYRDGRRSTIKRREDKGHRQQFQAFIAACPGRRPHPDSRPRLWRPCGRRWRPRSRCARGRR